MLARRSLIVLLMAVCAVIPVMFGASCPPASTPLLYSVIPDSNTITQSVVPGCTPDFVCVNLSNGTTFPVQFALYAHNGFDPNDLFPDPPSLACCSNPNALQGCPCACPGKTTGDCKLDRMELFQAMNQRAVNGVQALTLAPTQSVLTRIRCGDVKTVGAAVAQITVANGVTTGNAVTAPDDRNGPIWRDEPGGVDCGQTVQFLAIDLNQTVGTNVPPGQNLATLIIRAQFSN